MNLLIISENCISKKSIQLLSFQDAVIAAEVASLVNGIQGAVVVSIFSSALENSFLVPRTVPATAVIFTEPDVSFPRTTISRMHSAPPIEGKDDGSSCNRPIINVGQKISTAQYVAGSITSHVYNKYLVVPHLHNKYIADKLRKNDKILKKANDLWALLSQEISMVKDKFHEKLGIQCLVPRLMYPWLPILDYARCKLGLEDEGFMEAPVCNITLCSEADIEEREIAIDNGMPNLDTSTLDVNTMDDCFNNVEKVKYGVRVLAKLVDDVDCDNPEFKEACDEEIANQRIIEEEGCELPK